MLKNVKIKSMSIASIRKILLKKGFLLSRKSVVKKQASLQNLYKISLASLFIISFFYILPTSYKYVSKFMEPKLEIEIATQETADRKSITEIDKNIDKIKNRNK